jgi:superfamily I DNA/RNA helicase
VEGIEAAAKHAIEFVRQWNTAQGEGLPLSFCVIAASEKSRDAMAGLMQAAGLRCIAITAQSNHADARDVVHLATMHRAKGLEFDCVVVVAPKNYLGDTDETATKRKLLYVALTRAKRGAQLLLIN